MSPGVRALNRLAKWRSIFAGWQLGTRKTGDPESDAVRDHREITLLLRAEVNALTALLIDKDMITHEEYDNQLVVEVGYLEQGYERQFPGAKATDDGMQLDPAKVQPWMSKFPP